MSICEKIGFYPADIMLPQGVDFEKWAVVACDQFTSQPEYWEEVETIVGDQPSTLKLILPEAHLASPDVEERIGQINANMADYLSGNLLTEYGESLIYLERTQSDGKVRHGIVGMIDLDQYDFTPGSGALVRATEGTVLSRIPPRVKVREHAPLELPHVMLLIDDPEKTVIEPLSQRPFAKDTVYDFNLMQGGGSIRGRRLDASEMERVFVALSDLASPKAMEQRYGLKDVSPLLFAVGDGNHSLATAKRCYEDQKKITPASDWAKLPSRYALVEVVNNHDDALAFEPIHRVLFGVDGGVLLQDLLAAFPGAYEGEGEGHTIRYAFEGGEGEITIPNPSMQLEVGSLQSFLDEYAKTHPMEIDYIHGDEVTIGLGKKPGNLAFLLPAMAKSQLFKTVMADGVLPRKTFSMGHAQDKRYYLEARKIR